MADGNDSELRILIQTLANTYGVKEVEREMSKLTGTTEESGHAVERHNEHHREMRRLFMEMNKLLPESGHLLHGVFGGPQVFLIMAAVAALGKLVEMIKEHKKGLEEVAKAQAEVATAVWEEHRKHVEAVRSSWEAINHQTELMIRNVDTLNEKQKLSLEVLGEQNKAVEKMAGDDKLRAAELERQGAARKQAMLEEFALQDELELKKADARLRDAEAASAKGAPGGDSAAAAQSRLESHKGAVTKAQMALDHAQETLEGKHPFEATEETALHGILTKDGAVAFYRKKVKEAGEALERSKNAQVADEAAVRAHTDAQRKLDEAVKEAAEEVKRRFGTLHGAHVEAEKNAAVVGAQQQGATAGTLFGMGLKPGSVSGATALRGVQAAEAFMHGDRSQAQDQAIAAIVKGLISARVKDEKIAELMKEMADLHVTQEQKVKDLLDAMKLLKAQVRSTVNP